MKFESFIVNEKMSYIVLITSHWLIKLNLSKFKVKYFGAQIVITLETRKILLNGKKNQSLE